MKFLLKGIMFLSLIFHNFFIHKYTAKTPSTQCYCSAKTEQRTRKEIVKIVQGQGKTLTETLQEASDSLGQNNILISDSLDILTSKL